MDVCSLFGVVVGVLDSLLVVAFLPDFAVEVYFFLCAEGKSAFDELDRFLEWDSRGWCQNYMNVVAHDYEFVEFESLFGAVFAKYIE